jgi:hypothetical protein
VTNHNLNRSLGIWRKWRLLPEHFQEKACAGRGIRAFTPVFAGIRAFTPVFAGYGVASGFPSENATTQKC